MDINTIIQNASKIKLTGGLVGRVCTVLAIVVVAIAWVAGKSSIPWVAPLTILGLLVFCSVFLWRVLNIAEKNPHAAILDGAEFLKYELSQQSSKTQTFIEVSSENQSVDPSLPQLTDEIISQSNIPDVSTQIEDRRE